MEPSLVALLFADRVITENNGKKAIIGTFNIFHSPVFPIKFPPWFIYASVSNIDEECDFTLNLVTEDLKSVIFEISGKISAKQKEDALEMIIGMNNVNFKQAGNYILLFHVNGNEIGRRILKVSEVKAEVVK